MNNPNEMKYQSSSLNSQVCVDARRLLGVPIGSVRSVVFLKIAANRYHASMIRLFTASFHRDQRSNQSISHASFLIEYRAMARRDKSVLHCIDRSGSRTYRIIVIIIR